MLRHRVKQIAVVCLIIGTAIISNSYTIAKKSAGYNTVDLESIPERIGDWRTVSQREQMSAIERKFMDNVLIRNYRRPDGLSIYLAVAYGANQRLNFSIHGPEVCYRAAGYDVTVLGLTHLAQPDMLLKQLVARKGNVTERIQYWIVLNNKVVTNHFEHKLKQFYFSIMDASAGGVLVRVSSVSSTLGSAGIFDLQKGFIADLYKSLNHDQRRLLFGNENI